jgi:DNA-binding transcriptional regulator YiaG
MGVKVKKPKATPPNSGQTPAKGKSAKASLTPKPVSPPVRANRVTPATGHRAPDVAQVRKELGVTQDLFARMIGVSSRSVAGWEGGASINESSARRLVEMRRLASALKRVMKPDFLPRWLATPNEGLGGISPVEALERGESDRLWRAVFLLGSGLPL